MIHRKRDQSVIVTRVKLADSYWTRLIGWIGKREAAPGEGLLITETNSIHMWMMSIPIDVVFLNQEQTILKAISNLRPWRLLPVYCAGATSALELPAGTIESKKLLSGEVLCIVS